MKNNTFKSKYEWEYNSLTDGILIHDEIKPKKFNEVLIRASGRSNTFIVTIRDDRGRIKRPEFKTLNKALKFTEEHIDKISARNREIHECKERMDLELSQFIGGE